MAASDGKCSISTILREKKGTVNSLSMLLLIVTNCFITLAKGSCNKKSHFFRFRRLRKFRGSTVYNSTDSSYLKGLCHPTRMRELMKTNLKKTAQLFQVVSEILEGCFYLSKSQPSLDS